MSTNGASARQWLEDNNNTVPTERVQQIIRSLLGKIEKLDKDHPDTVGLLEALDVLEHYLLDLTPSQPPSTAKEVPFDTSPLTSNESAPEPLSQEEKQRRFKALLLKSDIKSDM